MRNASPIGFGQAAENKQARLQVSNACVLCGLADADHEHHRLWNCPIGNANGLKQIEASKHLMPMATADFQEEPEQCEDVVWAEPPREETTEAAEERRVEESERAKKRRGEKLKEEEERREERSQRRR